MRILRERETWKRKPSEPNERRRLGALTTEEQANVRRALRVLRFRFGTGRKLAEAMGVTVESLYHMAIPSKRVGARAAMRVARLAGVDVGEVLAGRWPPRGGCPWCGS